MPYIKHNIRGDDDIINIGKCIITAILLSLNIIVYTYIIVITIRDRNEHIRLNTLKDSPYYFPSKYQTLCHCSWCVENTDKQNEIGKCYLEKQYCSSFTFDQYQEQLCPSVITITYKGGMKYKSGLCCMW